MGIHWFMSIRHRNFPFLLEKCSMLMVDPSACDVSEQSYGNLKFGRIYSLNYLLIFKVFGDNPGSLSM